MPAPCSAICPCGVDRYFRFWCLGFGTSLMVPADRFISSRPFERRIDVPAVGSCGATVYAPAAPSIRFGRIQAADQTSAAGLVVYKPVFERSVLGLCAIPSGPSACVVPVQLSKILEAFTSAAFALEGDLCARVGPPWP